MQTDPQREQQEDEQGGGLNVEVMRSYLAFARQAIKQRRLLSLGILLTGLVLTGLIAKYIPRTYSCTTTLTAVANGVLDSDRGPLPLAGAENQILSHDNLETLINDSNLKKHYFARRPPLLALKDKLITSLAGPMDDKTLTAVLVGTLENKLTLLVEKDTLSITVDWSDAATTAELAEATKNAFLRVRHGAEISAFQDKMAILDTHAGKLRDEIDQLAQQMKERIAAKRAELEAEAKAEGRKDNGSVKRSAPARVFVASRKPLTDEQLPDLKERLVTLKQTLSTAESQRETRLREEQSKLSELQLRLTPNHPQVITQQERVGVASQVSSEILLMRAEQSDLESQIRQREAMAKTGTVSSHVGSSDPAGGGSELLPTEILGLLDEKDADPALSAQISGAIVRYGSLRDDVRGAKLALDTAQAAFNHRYRVVIPVDEPSQPIKPKVGAIVGVGIFLSLLLGMLLPVLLELRRDVVSETWQVHHLQLPVLAELRLPKGTPD
jgi:uncharacterized protein involved in exopolysaccharide biosynthesis